MLRMTQSKLYIVNAVSWQAAEIAHLCTLSTNTFFLNNVDDDDVEDGKDGDEYDDDDKKGGDNSIWRSVCLFVEKLDIFVYFWRSLAG